MIRIGLKYILLISFLICYTSLLIPVVAQNYVLSNWTVENGLSSNDVQDLLQDEAGFMWIATEHGLNQFDGYAFKKHRYHPNDSTSMGANYTNSICEDEEGKIWVSLGVGIVSQYDKRSNQFTNYFFPQRKTYLFDIKIAPGFGVYIATNHGLFTVDEAARKLVLLTTKEEDRPPHIYTIFPSTDKGMYLHKKVGFEFYHFSTNTTTPTFIVNQSDTTLFKYPVEKYYKDRKGVVWIQTTYGSLYHSVDGLHFIKTVAGEGKFAARSAKQTFIFEDDKNVKWFLSNTGELLCNDNYTSSWEPFTHQVEWAGFAFEDREKSKWICTKRHELLKWDGKDWALIIDLSDHLRYWEISNVFVDDKNGIWLGSRGKGLWRICNRKWPINKVSNTNPEQPIDFEITALLLEDQDKMWMGAYNNLYQYHFETKQLTPFFPRMKKENPTRGASVIDLKRSTNGELWIATSKGAIIVNEKKKNYRHLKATSKNNTEYEIGFVRTLLPATSGNMWIGTPKGLFFYNSATQICSLFRSSRTEGSSMRYHDIHCLSLINANEILIGYVKEGVDLCTFDSSNFTLSCQQVVYENPKRQQSDMMTANTFYLTEKDHWVGTFSKGLLKLNLEDKTMTHISDEFPIIPNVKAIQKDAKGKLWVSSIDGIRSVNPEDQTYYRFTKSSGLLSNHFYRSSSATDSLGNLYFGSANGLNKIQPANWIHQDTVATPILTAFKKYDENVSFETILDEVESITLNHEDEYITFEFVSPTYDNPEDVQYAYQLEGFDEKWRYCEKELSATYTNIAPGEYTFQVRAGNKGGFLNSKTKQIQIIVTPPFWQTSWFVLLIIGLVLFTGWLVYRIKWQLRTNRLRIISGIRKKAADDFHDELGHRLTKISLFVESLMLQKDSFPSTSAHTLRKIQSNANELYHSTRDFIWAMNPSKDSALELFILLRDFGDELFEDTAIQFSVDDIEEEYKAYRLDMDLKRQLVMIFKEAMTNALKHSKSTAVVLKIEECKEQLKIVLADNGKGFILDHKKFGYGLGSMFNRSKKVGGQLEINTQMGQGTEVVFKI